jgi:predicted Abi (CAAX) family protease
VSTFTRVRAALTTFPTAKHWLRFLLELGWLAPVLAALGWAGALVDPGAVDWPALLRLAAIALIVPALAEEVVFRAALLPAPSTRVSMLRLTLAIAAFVAWHPLQVLWFGVAWGETVLDPWFLAAVAALGIAASRLYLATASIWPPVILHWLVVIAWKALGGASPWN